MATFIGGIADEVITPTTVSATVFADGAARPSDAADTIHGGAGADTIDGGGGADFIDGDQGADLLIGGKGDDIIEWDPGDGSDTVDGGAGQDTLLFRTSNIAEVIGLSALGGHAILTRDVGVVSMDLDNVERLSFSGGGGGADTFNLGNLAGTDVRQIDIDLGNFDGSGDTLVDTVALGGRVDNDRIVVTTAGGVTSVSGLGAVVSVSHAEAIDRLAVDGGGGNDTLDLSTAAGGIGVGFNGGEGVDTLAVNGSGAADQIFLTGFATAATDDEDPIAILVNGQAESGGIINVESVVVSGAAGDDQINAGSLLLSAAALSISGGDGADSIVGSQGADTINGGAGNDLIDGSRGNDVLLGGGGTDSFQWNPGDASDTVDGGDSVDTLTFNGANISEEFSLTASASGHAILTRNVAGITMDLDNLEQVKVRALGGTDVFNLGDLRGTDTKQVDIDLGAVGGGGDSLSDTVAAGGTSGNDRFVFSTAAGVTAVGGVGVGLSIRQAEDIDRLALSGGAGADAFDVSALAGGIGFSFDGGDGADAVVLNGAATADQIFLIGFATTATDDADPLALQVNGQFTGGDIRNIEALSVSAGGGDDSISATQFLMGGGTLSLAGGDGADTILGSLGAETIDGGAGNDFIDGNRGADVLLGGGGNDAFQWDPGDGNDTVVGGDGFDRFAFNGSNISEILTLSNVNGHAILTRDVGGVTQDLTGVERVAFRALGGSDTLNIGDLSGAGVKQVDIDLGQVDGTTDGVLDTILLSGRAAGEQVVMTSAGDVLSITGLGSAVTISHPDFFDRLFINLGAGADVFDASGVGAQINLTVIGGDGGDNLKGSQGDDVLTGDAGNDTLAGIDGNDVFAGGAGSDRFVFAANVAGRGFIVDFQAHSAGAEADLIVINGGSDHSLAEAIANAHIIQSGTDVLVGDASGTIVTLQNVSLASLTSADFLFQ
jgi:Ca2+-binding RTX toxin-like protein